MKIQADCRKCKTPVRLKGRYNDRREMLREVGETVNLNCGECGLNQDVLVGKLTAKKNKWGEAAVYLISIILTLVIFWLLGRFVSEFGEAHNLIDLVGVATIPSLIYVIYSQQERERVSRFNQS